MMRAKRPGELVSPGRMNPPKGSESVSHSTKRAAGLAGAVLLLGMLLACGGGATSEGPAEPAPIPREDFKARVMGKTKDEVLEAIGKPSSTSETGRLSSWYYKNRTFDPLTNKPDRFIVVSFGADGKVRGVNF